MCIRILMHSFKILARVFKILTPMAIFIEFISEIANQKQCRNFLFLENFEFRNGLLVDLIYVLDLQKIGINRKN